MLLVSNQIPNDARSNAYFAYNIFTIQLVLITIGFWLSFINQLVQFLRSMFGLSFLFCVLVQFLV